MKLKLLTAVAALMVSGMALAQVGENRAPDLTSNFEAINDAINGRGYTQPEWQQPIQTQRQTSNQPETLTVRKINNHRGEYFYKNFTFRRDNGRVYELEVEPHYLNGYELDPIGTTTFDAVDRRTGEKVKLEVPRRVWMYSR